MVMGWQCSQKMMTLKALAAVSVKVGADGIPDPDGTGANQHKYRFWGQTLLLGGCTEPASYLTFDASFSSFAK